MKDNYKKLYESFDKSIYSISMDLIKNICNDLNKSDKIEIFIEKYLLKPNTKSIKKMKDKNCKKTNQHICFSRRYTPKIKS